VSHTDTQNRPKLSQVQLSQVLSTRNFDFYILEKPLYSKECASAPLNLSSVGVCMSIISLSTYQPTIYLPSNNLPIYLHNCASSALNPSSVCASASLNPSSAADARAPTMCEGQIMPPETPIWCQLSAEAVVQIPKKSVDGDFP
jgi:hypothetical protein